MHPFGDAFTTSTFGSGAIYRAILRSHNVLHLTLRNKLRRYQFVHQVKIDLIDLLLN